MSVIASLARFQQVGLPNHGFVEQHLDSHGMICQTASTRPKIQHTPNYSCRRLLQHNVWKHARKHPEGEEGTQVGSWLSGGSSCTPHAAMLAVVAREGIYVGKQRYNVDAQHDTLGEGERYIREKRRFVGWRLDALSSVPAEAPFSLLLQNRASVVGQAVGMHTCLRWCDEWS